MSMEKEDQNVVNTETASETETLTPVQNGLMLEMIKKLLTKQSETDSIIANQMAQIGQLMEEKANIKRSSLAETQETENMRPIVHVQLSGSRDASYPGISYMRAAKPGEFNYMGVVTERITTKNDPGMLYIYRDNKRIMGYIDRQLKNMSVGQKADFLEKQVQRMSQTIDFSYRGEMPLGSILEVQDGIGRSHYVVGGKGLESIDWKTAYAWAKEPFEPSEGKEPVQLLEEGDLNGSAYTPEQDISKTKDISDPRFRPTTEHADGLNPQMDMSGTKV